MTMQMQISSQHFTITQGGGQSANGAGSQFELFDAWQPTQGSQQAAQAPHGGAQVMQRFIVGDGGEASLAAQQPYFQANDLSD